MFAGLAGFLVVPFRWPGWSLCSRFVWLAAVLGSPMFVGFPSPCCFSFLRLRPLCRPADASPSCAWASRCDGFPSLLNHRFAHPPQLRLTQPHHHVPFPSQKFPRQPVPSPQLDHSRITVTSTPSTNSSPHQPAPTYATQFPTPQHPQPHVTAPFSAPQP